MGKGRGRGKQGIRLEKIMFWLTPKSGMPTHHCLSLDGGGKKAMSVLIGSASDDF